MLSNDIRRELFGEEDQVDLTNLIDLMVVICAVLMICLPAYSTIATQLARQGHVRPANAEEPPITVSFSADEQLRWNEEDVTWSQLEERLRSLPRERPCKVLVAGDEGASYGFSIRLRAMIAKQGVEVNELTKFGKDK